MNLDKIVFKIRNSELDENDVLKYGKILIKEFAKEYHKEQLTVKPSSLQLKNDTKPTFEEWLKSEGYEETNKLGYYKKENKNIAFKRVHYKYYTTVFF